MNDSRTMLERWEERWETVNATSPLAPGWYTVRTVLLGSNDSPGIAYYVWIGPEPFSAQSDPGDEDPANHSSNHGPS